jgi:hypothetical protein
LVQYLFTGPYPVYQLELCRKKGLVSDTDKQIGTAIKRRIVTAQTLYLLGALLGLINPYWGIGVIIIIQLNYAFAVISNK